MKANIENNSVDTGSRFLASTMHEVRTPIQTIISTTELLEDTELNKEQMEYVRQIEFSANVLLQLANDVLDYTKITSHEFQLENIPFDVVEMTEHVVDLICIEAFNKGLEIITSIDSALPKLVMGDPVRVQQIILNLVKNAVKFTSNGYVLVVLKRVNGDMYFEVSDSGIGIPVEQQPLVFNKYYQVDASTTRRFGGTGLGLSICKNLVDIMGGKIGVRSNPTGGSIFWFTIPLQLANLGNEKRFKLEVPAGTKILVVDDREVALRSMTEKLMSLGIRDIEPATNGHEALAKLKAASDAGAPFTIAFIDMVMPGMDGWRLGAEINSSKYNNMKLYLMVPEGQMGGEAKMKLLNWFNGYVYKPVKINPLLNTLIEIFTSPLDLPPAEEEKNILAPKNSESTMVFSDASVAAGKKILVAEDHPVNRKIIETFLIHYGATVFSAENGEEAVQKIDDHPDIDLIFMDILMPVKSGLDATVEIRRKNYNGIIIACTANNDKDDFVQYRKQGINDILVKPFKRESIKQMLEKWNAVLLLPKAKNILSLTNVKNRAGDLWDVADFMDTVGDDRTLANNLMGMYLDGTEKTLEKIGEELEKENLDFDALEKYAHTLKGSSASVSAKKLAEIAKTMDEASKVCDRVAIEAARMDFAIDFMELRNLVKKWSASI